MLDGALKDIIQSVKHYGFEGVVAKRRSSFDALIFGHYEGDKLIYVAKTRNGFTPRLRPDLYQRFRKLETKECPFANLPELKGGRWGAGLTAEKMKECRYKPKLVGQFEFVEWTPDNHLRHSRFVGLREDKDPSTLGRERPA